MKRPVVHQSCPYQALPPASASNEVATASRRKSRRRSRFTGVRMVSRSRTRLSMASLPMVRQGAAQAAPHPSIVGWMADRQIHGGHRGEDGAELAAAIAPERRLEAR